MEKDLNKLSEEYQTTDRKRRPNYGNPDGFEPCPFCGARPHIRVEDDEGNCHDYDPDYEKSPWSGLWYVIEHTKDYSPRRGDALKNTGDIPWNKDCLIATEGFEWWGFGGVPHIGGDKAVFKTRKAAVKWWNRMVAKARPAEKARTASGKARQIKIGPAQAVYTPPGRPSADSGPAGSAGPRTSAERPPESAGEGGAA